MAHLPARLPASEADLADWMVYADELQREGDPLGELIALDLSLPTDPSAEQIARWRGLANRRCWRNSQTIGAFWTLGYARSVTLIPSRKLSPQDLDDGTLARITDLFAHPTFARLERLDLPMRQPTVSRPLRRVLEAIPTSVTSVRLTSGSGNIEALVQALPLHVTKLALLYVWGDPTPAITDRFEEIEVRGELLGVDAVLARTSHVRFRMWNCDVTRYGDRVVPGSNCGFIVPATRSLIMLRDRAPGLFEQREHGLIPIRAQLARTITEGESDHRATIRCIDQVWTITRKKPEFEVRVGANVLAAGETAQIRDGDTLELEGESRILCTHDLVARAKAMF